MTGISNSDIINKCVWHRMNISAQRRAQPRRAKRFRLVARRHSGVGGRVSLAGSHDRMLLSESGRLFERISQLEHREICSMTTDDLNANRESIRGESGWDGNGRPKR